MAINPAVRDLLDAAHKGGVPLVRIRELLGVSRATFHAWTAGANPSSDNARECEAMTARINAAIQAGALPIKPYQAALRAVLGV